MNLAEILIEKMNDPQRLPPSFSRNENLQILVRTLKSYFFERTTLQANTS